jgi:predicted acylesterase/phospholipase RssA
MQRRCFAAQRRSDVPRLALILSGAGSLGTFEAGVLTELLWTLEHTWRQPDPSRRWTLDVVTGASAGAMTAALVARAVMADHRAVRSLHAAWVNDIDIRDLLREPPGTALLSKEPIRAIATRHLVAPAPDAIRAPYAPERLRLRFTLANMNGVDWRYPLARQGEEAFVATFFADGVRFDVTPANVRDPTLWERMRSGAIASGNFPLVFVPELLTRDERDFRDHSLSAFPGTFTYCDGGLFDNEPVGDAIDLALEQDGGTIALDRAFVLVDANLNRSRHAATFTERETLLANAARLVAMVRGEATVRDWLKSQRVNNECDWRDRILVDLISMVRDTRLDDAPAFSARLYRSATDIVATKRAIFPDRYPASYLDAALERTRETHATRFEGLTPLQQEILVRLIFLLNSVAGLDKKQQLNIGIIYTEPLLTAGDTLGAFGGFFRREWREHDYRLGRRAARARLPGLLELEATPPPEPGFEHEYDIPPEWETFKNATMRDADVAPRIALRDMLVKRARKFVEAQTIGPRWLRWVTGPASRAAVAGTVKARLNRVLGLSDNDVERL